jgi:cobalt-zinc-cadmium efflux system outer membrane protein
MLGVLVAGTSDAQHSGAAKPGAAVALTRSIGLDELTHITLAQHPRLAQVAYAVDVARGRAVQAGLYPNPNLSITGDEISDRTGPGGIWTAPTISQEIVTGNKLRLSRAVALKDIDQATLTVISERYRVLTAVRQSYFDVVTQQRRIEILGDLVKLADKSVENTERLLKANQVARLDLIQLEVDQERYRAELEAAQRALPAAYRQLAAAVGVSDLADMTVVGSLDSQPPDYDLDRLRAYVVSIHPDIRHAQVGIERANLALKRAKVEVIPNITLSTGYTYQGQNRSNDWNIGLSLPIPVWNRNQGNIFSANAHVGEAIQEVGRVQNELVSRLANAYAGYASARKRVERYRVAILPRAQESYQLSLKAFQGGQFEYLRVLQSQRSVVEANLEYVRAQGDMWKAASEIAGLMLEDEWPNPPAAGEGGAAIPLPPPQTVVPPK